MLSELQLSGRSLSRQQLSWKRLRQQHGPLLVQGQAHAALQHRYARRRAPDAAPVGCVLRAGAQLGLRQPGVWVSNGCRAEFVSGGGNYGPGYGNRPGDYYYGQTVRCESNDRRQRRCNVSVRRGVDIVRQLSKTRCVQGQNWGWDRSGIWVRGGCRAEFRVY